jgi:ribonuclease BN (tRNA processing enzyme)
MHLRVLGCHGGETPRHRTSSFLLDGTLSIDAGAVTSVLSLEEQFALRAVVVSHAHFDHVRDLATLADNRCQGAGEPLVVAGTAQTVAALREHFFNNLLWPDFATIPLVTGEGSTLVFQVLEPEVSYDVAGYRTRAVMVSHTIESAGLVVERDGVALAYSGDTGPTDRYWEVLRQEPSLRMLLQEVSFPNELEWLAERSGHHTPATVDRELGKLGGRTLPVVFYHIKPCFQTQVERELAALRGSDLAVAALGDEYEF